MVSRAARRPDAPPSCHAIYHLHRLESLTVVIPTRNRLGYLQQAVGSIVRQGLKLDVIVVDDGSTDGTTAWLRTQTRLRHVVHEHRGRGAARNVGLALAEGTWCMFMDDDDLLMPGALEALLGMVDSDTLAIAGRSENFDSAGRVWPSTAPRRSIRSIKWQDMLLGWVPGQAQYIVRSSAVRSVGGWDPTMDLAEDHELWLRLIEHEGDVRFTPYTARRYRVQAGQVRLDSFIAQRTIRAAFVARQTARRRVAARVFRAWEHLALATRMAMSGERLHAIAHLAEAARSYPQLLGSPVHSRSALHTAKHAFLGR